ncbi:DEAD/DEAH box helicase family protein [Calidifontibacter sp. DB0510]|uniref:DEAD/DEAH box helicase family protein n=1 Tax=Metallococcus carri TaxID=1656884 RepID=A0A967AXI3_9MICO|nr:DEAD/DEAH box helicase family protein [Metallococcus carri]NHN54824.1 DEAD/DEAH box helicase family protein [Metallococcus carri]NOP37169.1 DEAD/DEAH box helicase family protein [Calidifontibacter sp. DB2511S]
MQISKVGRDWLLEADKPASDWKDPSTAARYPLREWQGEALNAWSLHGRHGVIEAVTGTGKSRVGIEATREALRDDYNVVIVVPTIDLIAQWVKALKTAGLDSIGTVGDGQRADFGKHSVIVGTIQSLYSLPPTRPDGKVLLVADECHRYGAGQWSRILHTSYRRRLGLTATFERNDDGITLLQNYFGGTPIYRLGFPRAVADGVVARYDVNLLGVRLTDQEREAYDRADEILRDSRQKLTAAGLPEEPFGAFIYKVQEAAKDVTDPAITDLARRYLKAFSDRIDIMTCAQAKLEVIAHLAPQVSQAAGALIFTRRVDMAESLSDRLVSAGVSAAAVHSELTRFQRRERLHALKVGRLKAIVAPTLLDEGIDVPEIDLAIVMGGSKSRRQMIQRMGRVLRLKADRRKATFFVIYAIHTAEDLTETNGDEGCLDLIVESADKVTSFAVRAGQIVASGIVPRSTPLGPLADSGDVIGETDRSAVELLPPDSAQHALASSQDRATPVAAKGGMRRVPTEFKMARTPAELFAADPSLVRGFIDARTLAFAAAAVMRGAEQFGLGDAFDDSTLEALRALLADDLEADPAVVAGEQKLVIHGRCATWTLRSDAQVVLDVAAVTASSVTRERTTAPYLQVRSDLESTSVTSPNSSIVDQLERLAGMWQRGFLTADEFTAAKAQLLQERADAPRGGTSA